MQCRRVGDDGATSFSLPFLVTTTTLRAMRLAYLRQAMATLHVWIWMQHSPSRDARGVMEAKRRRRDSINASQVDYALTYLSHLPPYVQSYVVK